MQSAPPYSDAEKLMPKICSCSLTIYLPASFHTKINYWMHPQLLRTRHRSNVKLHFGRRRRKLGFRNLWATEHASLVFPNIRHIEQREQHHVCSMDFEGQQFVLGRQRFVEPPQRYHSTQV